MSNINNNSNLPSTPLSSSSNNNNRIVGVSSIICQIGYLALLLCPYPFWRMGWWGWGLVQKLCSRNNVKEEEEEEGQEAKEDNLGDLAVDSNTLLAGNHGIEIEITVDDNDPEYLAAVKEIEEKCQLELDHHKRKIAEKMEEALAKIRKKECQTFLEARDELESSLQYHFASQNSRGLMAICPASREESSQN